MKIEVIANRLDNDIDGKVFQFERGDQVKFTTSNGDEFIVSESSTTGMPLINMCSKKDSITHIASCDESTDKFESTYRLTIEEKIKENDNCSPDWVQS